MSPTLLPLTLPECLSEDFPAELPVAERTVERVLARVAGADLSSLAARSPGLAGNDWAAYLRCTIARMVHVAAALTRRGIHRGRILDYGSWFGNMALMLAGRHYTVDAIDEYREYRQALGGVQTLLADAGVGVLDFADAGRDLHGLTPATYDVVLCMGVIEHVPHTPRPMLEALNRVLKPGGLLIVDTPNHAYIHNRQRLATGASVMADISAQYYAVPPFEGHHREYTPSELVWMLKQIGHDAISVEMFNYSVYSVPVLTGIDLANHWASALDPSSRELILTVSRRADEPPATDAGDWRAAFVETEPSWVRRVPDEVRLQLEEMSAETLGARKLQEYYVDEIARRDQEITDVHQRLGALEHDRDRRFAARVGRLWRRLFQ